MARERFSEKVSKSKKREVYNASRLSWANQPPSLIPTLDRDLTSQEAVNVCCGALAGAHGEYSKRIVERTYNWVRFLANHAYTVHRR